MILVWLKDIRTLVARLVDLFIPGEIFEFYHEEEVWKARSVVFVLLVNIFFVCLGYVIHLLSNLTPENLSQAATAGCLLNLAGYCLALALFRFSLPYSVAANVFAVTVVSSISLVLSAAKAEQFLAIMQLLYVLPMFVYIISGFALAAVWILIILAAPQVFVAFFAGPEFRTGLQSWAISYSYFIGLSMLIMFYVVDSYRRQITDRLNFERMEFEYAASHDVLTGLANRSAFEKRFADMLEASQFNGENVVLIMLDLDGFKPINDQYGHHAGDQLLKEISRRLREAMRTTDTVARLGGDEFAILCAKFNDRDKVAASLKNLVEIIARPVVYENKQLSVSASIGVVSSPQHGKDMGSLLRKADSAMYLAKKEKGRYHIFSDGDL